MEWTEVELDRTSQFPVGTIPSYEDMLSKPLNKQALCADYIGGIINDGRCGWVTRRNAERAELQIYWLKSGATMANYIFLKNNNRVGQVRCTIRAVVEILTIDADVSPLLAVAIQTPEGKTKVAIYTPNCSQVLRYIDLDMGGINAHTLTFVNASICKKSSILDKYDGCLAVGTIDGSVLLIDVKAQHLIATRCKSVNLPDSQVQRGAIICLSLNHAHDGGQLDATLLISRKQDKHMVLIVEMPPNVRSSIMNIKMIDIISGFAAGLQDGRVFIYDLCRFHMVAEVAGLPEDSFVDILGLCYILPPDDPQPCFYICAVYNQSDYLMASLHVVNYRRFGLPDDNCEVFRSCDFRNTSLLIRLVLDTGECSLIGCSTVSTIGIRGDNGTLLIVISWQSQVDSKNKLMLFDINQWYKDEMPSRRSGSNPNYLCGLELNGRHSGLDLQLNPRSIVHFSALRRHDAHFYPNALSFDCTLMTVTGCHRYVHDGVQRRFLNTMYMQKANLFLDPQPFLDKIIKCNLSPQFYEHNANASLTGHDMYEVILSVALEQDGNSLLFSCARYCLDGSFLCNMLGTTKLTLTVLTNWIVKRAAHIRGRCSELCQGLFDYGGYPLDECEHREFQALNAQLFKLHELQSFIFKQGQNRFVLSTINTLNNTMKTLSVLYEYQRLLYWFIKSGILPINGRENQQALEHIRRKYAERRHKLHQSDAKLYIDEQLKRSGCAAALKHNCQQEGLYPPQSMQALMRLILLPTVSLLNKHELVLYLLHDLDELVVVPQNKSTLASDFATVFGIGVESVKRTRCFWFLDNDNIKQAMKDFETGYPDWQTELLVGVLLAQGAKKSAMHVMIRMSVDISSTELQLKVLLENNNIPKAFHLARSYMDARGRQPFLEYVFNHCISTGKFSVLNSLAMHETEEQLLYRLLRQSKSTSANCAHLIMLLKRHNYIDAVSLIDDGAAEQQQHQGTEDYDRFTYYMNSFLTSYRRSMAPINRSLTDKYFRIRDRLTGDRLCNLSPVPLSCQLAAQNTKGKLGDIFENAVLSSHWAGTSYREESQLGRPLNGRNMPFLCKPLQGLDWRFMQAPLLRSTAFSTCRTLPQKAQEAHARNSKRKRGEWAEQERRALQDDSLVEALLQPPSYLQLKTSTIVTTATVTAHQEQSPLTQAILKKRLSVHATQPLEKTTNFSFMPPIPLAEAMQQYSGDEDNEMEEEKHQPKYHYQEAKKQKLHHQEQQQQQQQQQLLEVEVEEEEEGLDEIFVEIDQQSASPNPERMDTDTESIYLSQPASCNVSFADNSQQLTDQKPTTMAPPTGPQPRSSLLRHTSSSGFGSFATVQMGNTGSLQLTEFVPPVCSSKMGSSSQVKFSERSTICGCVDDPTVLVSQPAWSMRSVTHTEAVEPPSPQMLDTTLGMSSYDLTALEPATEAEPTGATKDEPSSVRTYTYEYVVDEQQNYEEEIEVDVDVEKVEEEEDNVKVEQEKEEDREMREQEMKEWDLMEREIMERELLERDIMEREMKEQQVEEQDEDVEVEEQEEEQEDEQDDEQEEEHKEDEDEEEEEPIPMSYIRVTSSFNINSELLDLSSSEVVAPRPDSPIYSIADSSTTSRSPTSHTPTSFLPSDTNVSSSPRGVHGGAGNGSNRSLYRANSLETVDDQDTTKGSLVEDDDVDLEDDCVIALDGTEVRGYVARPEPAAATVFKQQDEKENQSSTVVHPIESAVETLQSNEILIVSDNEENEAEPVTLVLVVSDNEEEADPQPKAEEELIPLADKSAAGSPKQKTADSSPVAEHNIDLRSRLRSQDPLPSASVSPMRRSLRNSIEEQPTPEVRLSPVTTPSSRIRSLRSSSRASDDQSTPEVRKSVDTPSTSRGRLRSADDASNLPERRLLRGGSMPATSKPVPVSTPKRHKLLLPKPLGGIQEEAETVRSSSEPPAAVVAKRGRKLSEEPNSPIVAASDSVEQAELPLDPTAKPQKGRPRRRSSEQSALSDRIAGLRSQDPLPSASVSPVRRSLRNSIEEQTTPEMRLSPVTTPSSRIRSLRSSSRASDDQSTPEVRETIDSPSTSRGRLRSADDASNLRQRRLLRAGSMPATSKPVPVSTPKRHKLLLPKPLDGIQEEAETVRSSSEPPAAIVAKRGRKPSREQTQDSSTLPSRNLRSRRNTEDADVVPVEVPPLPDASVPPKKRGRPKKLT
ncbi:protein ELYS homolog [Drosophila grimshawi]|uniref:GH12099 n=1 Tax=Drosophila grimshawi TaxID=7222 RepID=B4JK80_DROGR|nr:protein ELYS homolog [Drosophila grimshawi]EDV99982.1 GH12099 [Drosophila grimshawi]